LDKSDRVIFIKSFSKIFMPGLRLGFMLVPAKLSQHLLEAKHTTDISTSGLIQRAFDLYIRKGYWDSHFTFMYNIYRERYDKIIEALESCMPEPVKWVRPGGGLNIWLSLPYGFPMNNLVTLAAAHDIVFAPGRIFYSAAAPQAANNIRLSFAAVSTPQIEKGISSFCEAVDQLLGDNPPTKSMLIL
jgi:DNA-binding transcriptional MocR family regulator